MEKCRRMNRQRCMSKNWTYSWLWKSSKTRQQYYRSESFAMKTGIPTNGSMVKNHISVKTEFGLFAIRRISYLSWFQACLQLLQARQPQHPRLLQVRKLIIPSLPQDRLPQHPWHLQRRLIINITLQQSCQVNMLKSKNGETCVFLEPQKRTCWLSQQKIQNQIKNEDHDLERGDLLNFRHPRVAARIQRKS